RFLRTYAARDAFAARFVAKESNHIGGQGAHIGSLGDHNHRTGSERRAGAEKRIEIERRVHRGCRQKLGRGATRDESVQITTVHDTAAQLNELADGSPHGDLVDTWLLDVPGKGHEFESGESGFSLFAPPIGTALDNPGHDCQALYIINESR